MLRRLNSRVFGRKFSSVGEAVLEKAKANSLGVAVAPQESKILQKFWTIETSREKTAEITQNF